MLVWHSLGAVHPKSLQIEALDPEPCMVVCAAGAGAGGAAHEGDERRAAATG